MDFNFQVSQETKQIGYKINIRVCGHGVDLTNTIAPDAHKSYCSIYIPNPQLWFPNGYGEPNLYDYSIELVVNGQVVDSRKGKFGIRETKIQENPFTPEAGTGKSFNIVINDEPVFCKGANWIPMEILPATIDPSRYEFYLRKFKEAHFNMIRVWGGGIYEKDRFYQLCDELGIMVWQDFMFASAGYPWDTLKDEILQEADYQIKRLRAHPSVVLWCGINEDVYSWVYSAAANKPLNSQADIVAPENSSDEKFWKVDRYRTDPLLFHAVLRGMVGEFGMGVPYVASSPSSQDDFGNYPASGNHHQSCWKYALFQTPDHPENYRRYFNTICSFDSEFCIQGPCNEKAIRQFMAPENVWPPNNAWIVHVQRGHKDLPHFEQTLMIAGGIFGQINSLSEYVKYGQTTHLEQMRDEFESARRDRPNNGGTMVWMYNDCWPTANWSIIDYYRQPKPAYYAAKRACAPMLPIIFERNGQIEFFVSNDTLTNAHVSLSYGQESLDGRQIWKRQAHFVVGKNSTYKFAKVARAELKIVAGDYLFIEASIDGRKMDNVIWFPNGWKNIVWPQPKLQVELVEQKKGRRPVVEHPQSVNGQICTPVPSNMEERARHPECNPRSRSVVL